MRKRFLPTALLAAALCGCLGSDPPMNTAPLTEEQLRKVREEDRRTEEEERSGSGTATPAGGAR